MVEPVDVLGDGDLEVVDALPGALVADQLGLEQRVERLGEGVVVASRRWSRPRRRRRPRPGAGCSARRGTGRPCRSGAITPVVSSAGVLAGPQPHLEGVEGQVGAQALRQLPADDAAGEHVDDERGVDPAGEGAAVGDVGDPQLVRCRRGEGAVHQVRAGVGPGAGDRGAWALGPRDPAQTGGAHQPMHGAAGDPVALAVQLGVHLADAVDAVVRPRGPARSPASLRRR